MERVFEVRKRADLVGCQFTTDRTIAADLELADVGRVDDPIGYAAMMARLRLGLLSGRK